MNVLEELYYGNVCPNEKSFERKSEYARFVGILSENEQKLTEFLSALPNAEKELHMLSQMINAQSEISSFGDIERFIEGFRLGARFMLDTFIIQNDSVFRDIS